MVRPSASRPVLSPEGLPCCSELRYSKNKTASPAGTARMPNACVSHCEEALMHASVTATAPRTARVAPTATARYQRVVKGD